METSEETGAGSTAFLLSPAIGELLSGSATPVEFFNRFGFIIIACLYGSGAVLVRELTVRWGKGWPTMLALGAAYGIMDLTRPPWFWLTGFLGMLLFFVVFWGLPNSTIPAAATMLVGILFAAVAAWLIVRMSGNGNAWTDRHKTALVSGALTFFILLSPIREFGGNATDNPAGMTIVGLATAVMLIILWWHVSRRENAALAGPALP
ncbi:MAG: hypothetical protein A2147_05745 [Chloroflexi bacterium RBG_16_57_8]|nr:MAG: hypothetical protein A2147_05745 [Chloroflexi bacterium RBG_16_57_8]